MTKAYPRDGRRMRQAPYSRKRAVSNLLRAYRWGVGYLLAYETMPDFVGPALVNMRENVGGCIRTAFSEDDRRRVHHLAIELGRAKGSVGVQ